MLAYVLDRYGAPFVPVKRALPSIGRNELLVRVRAAGICGTDLKARIGEVARVSEGTVLGHEVAGEVADRGGDVTGFALGALVSLYFRAPCDACSLCRAGRENLCTNAGKRLGFERDGGFAEYVVIEAKNAIPVEGLAPEQAAILSDAVATAVHAVDDVAVVQRGDVVAVLGAGGLGSHAAQVAKYRGAEVIVCDPNPARLRVMTEEGIRTHLIANDTSAHGSADGIPPGPFGVVIDCFGASDITQYIERLRPRGAFVAVGYYPDNVLQVSQQRHVRGELRLLGASSATRANLAESARLVRSGALKAVVGEVRRMEEINEAFTAAAARSVPGRIVLVP